LKSIEQRFERLARAIQKAWYEGASGLPMLYPLSNLVGLIAKARWRTFRRRAEVPPVPLLVVGNITVGGTGKTPLVVALCEHFSYHGIKVAVISRGYGANPPSLPWSVSAEQSAQVAGDEPLLIARRTGLPVVIDPNRRRAMEYAVREFQPDIIISDDGLQHFRLPRTLDLVMLDPSRGLGNGRCLPAGPLREPADRLAQVDYLVLNGKPDSRWPTAVVMALQSGDPVNLVSGETLPMEEFAARNPLVHAFAGIGHPQRFFSTLASWDIRVTGHPLPDHHQFVADDFSGLQGQTVIMTEKDAVKCSAIAGPDFWYLPVTARLPGVFLDDVLDRLQRSRR